MARGNISSLGIGSGSYKDYMAKQVSLSISRNQYRANMSDERLQLIRNAVYKMVSNWPPEDNMAILTEYGDGGVLKKNYSKEDLNRALTESIIIHLDPADLEQLYTQVTAESRKMSRDIKRIEKKRRQRAKTSFNTGRMDAAYDRIKDKKHNMSHNIKKAIKEEGGGMKIPRYVQSQFRKLKKEVMDVLDECFDVYTLTRYALSLGIDSQGFKKKELYNQIANKILLYAAMVTGKNKKLFLGGMLDDAGVETCKAILKYTSYAYLTGEETTDGKTWVELREAARKAKAIMQARSKQKKLGQKNRGGLIRRAINRNIGAKEADYFADMSTAEILELAGKYGINASKFKNTSELYGVIYKAIEKDSKTANKLVRKATRGGKIDPAALKGRRKRKLDQGELRGGATLRDQERAARADEAATMSALEAAASSAGIISDGILGAGLYSVPIREGGRIDYHRITHAVPVLVVGQSLITKVASGSKNDMDIYNAHKNDKNITLEKMAGYLGVDPEYFKDLDDLKQKIYASEIDDEGNVKATRDDVAINAENDALNINKSMFGGGLNDTVGSILRATNYIASYTGSIKAGIVGNSDTSSMNVGVRDHTDLILDYLTTTLEDHIVRYEESTQQHRDYLHMRLGDMYKRLGWIKKDTVSLRDKRGFSVNGMTGELDFVPHHAAGATQFIAGDSLTNKPNPELVTVKGDGTYSVRPIGKGAQNGFSDLAIPQHAEGIYDVNGLGKATRRLEKAKKILDDIEKRSTIVNTIKSLGGKPPANWMTVREGTLARALSKAVHKYARLTSKSTRILKLNNFGQAIDKEIKGKLNSNSEINTSNGIQPVLSVNNDDAVVKAIKEVNKTLNDKFIKLFTGLAIGFPIVGAANGGIGTGFAGIAATEGINVAIDGVASAAISAAKEGLGIANTGGYITKFASGGMSYGNSIIAGDASGRNIFANGARPELVQSNGSMKVTPLHRAGDNIKQKISRMTQSERAQALATALSSHIIKYSYTLPNGAEDVSNQGEAIKVFNVKPGITDTVSVGGTETTLVEILASIATQLNNILGTSVTDNQLLSNIATSSSIIASNTTKTSSGNSNPYAGGFPSGLDSILGGE